MKRPTFYRTTQVDGLSIFYREAGPKDAPTLLLLHGLPSSSRMFRAAALSAFRSLSPGSARLSGLWPQRLAGRENIRVHVRSLRRDHQSLLRSGRAIRIHAPHAGLRWPLWVFAWPWPIRIESRVSSSRMLWRTTRAWARTGRRVGFWADRSANEGALRANLLSLQTTRTRHVGNDPNVERYNPDLWTDEFAFLNQPAQVEIQSDLFYDYRTNVENYPKWQAWMRERQPRLLVIWGKFDLSFELSEPEAYRQDVSQAQVHVLDAGHFALDTKADDCR